MRLFADFVALCRRLESTRGRLDKRRLVAEYLRALPGDDIANAVAFLTARPFPVSDPRVLGVRSLSVAPASPSSGTPLTLGDIASAFGEIASASGSGSRALREQALGRLVARASD